MSQTAFSSLDLDPDLLDNLSSLGYDVMTPIQAESLPDILAGNDVIAQGKTGSGKTAAFGLGLLNTLDVSCFKIQSLVLCPTRELADQVAKEIRKLARGISNIKVLTLCGGMPYGPQLTSLQHGAHIIVGTPGRIEELLFKDALPLDQLQSLVLDEADRMLDMGFLPAIEAIVETIPTERQTLLLSATYPRQIQSMAKRFMKQPIMVQDQSTHDSSTIEQHFYKVGDDEARFKALILLLQQAHSKSCVIFCNTKQDTREVAEALQHCGYSALALYGRVDQKERTQILTRFSNRSINILVATDIASRGLDIDSVDVVINYHLVHDMEVHIHRVGRTGRAGSKGVAHTLYNDDEGQRITQLQAYLQQEIVAEVLPSRKILSSSIESAPMMTLQIDGVKKYKVRAGDILGALTGDQGIDSKQVGKINIFDYCAYVAVCRDVADVALKKLTQGKMKGRSFRVKLIED